MMIREVILTLFLPSVHCTTLLAYPAGPFRPRDDLELPLTQPLLLTSVRTFEQSLEHTEAFSKGANGTIILKADEGYGIMIVMQQMNLQKDGDNGECSDYVKMSQVSGDDEETPKICGTMMASTSATTPCTENEMGQCDYSNVPSYLDKTGWVEVDYSVQDKRVAEKDQEELKTMNNFNISFTPFTECPEDAFPFGNGVLRPCSMLDSFSCISSEFFCDGVINCAFPHEVGLDELNCPARKEDEVKDTVVLLGMKPSPEGDPSQEEEAPATTKKPLYKTMDERGRELTVYLLNGKISISTITLGKILLLLGMVGSLVLLCVLRRIRQQRKELCLMEEAVIRSRVGECCSHPMTGVNPKELEARMYVFPNTFRSSWSLSLEVDEGHPLPAYDELSLLHGHDDQPVYRYELSYDTENPPPTYEEVQAKKT